MAKDKVEPEVNEPHVPDEDYNNANDPDPVDDSYTPPPQNDIEQDAFKEETEILREKYK